MLNDKFLLTGRNFEGGFTLEYEPRRGLLVKMDLTEATLTLGQHEWLINNIPVAIEDMKRLRDDSRALKITKVEDEITFDDFYEKYAHKVGKQKAKNAWKRLSRTDQLKAYAHISMYHQHLRQHPGQAQAYPATYLNQKRWED